MEGREVRIIMGFSKASRTMKARICVGLDLNAVPATLAAVSLGVLDNLLATLADPHFSTVDRGHHYSHGSSESCFWFRHHALPSQSAPGVRGVVIGDESDDVARSAQPFQPIASLIATDPWLVPGGDPWASLPSVAPAPPDTGAHYLHPLDAAPPLPSECPDLSNAVFAKQAVASLTSLTTIPEEPVPSPPSRSPSSSAPTSSSFSPPLSPFPSKCQRTSELQQVVQSTISETLHNKRQEYVARYQPLLDRACTQLPPARFHELHQEILNEIDGELAIIEASLRNQIVVPPLPP